MLDLFDVPKSGVSTALRNTTTVASQTLFLLNDNFAQQQATAFALRIQEEVGNDPGSQVDHAFRLAQFRSPSTTERQTSLDYMTETTQRLLSNGNTDDSTPVNNHHRTATLSLTALCLTLFNVNEFVYVD